MFGDASDLEPEVVQSEDLYLARELDPSCATCFFIWGKSLNLSWPHFLEDADDDSAYIRPTCENQLDDTCKKPGTQINTL